MSHVFRTGIFCITFFVAISGCATTRARRLDNPDLAAQVQSLQTQLQARDRQIQELQAESEGYGRALRVPVATIKPAKSSVIRISGVSPADLQRALARAGFDPGPADGRIGQKTKAAIKEFQKKHGLKADGVVGVKTWSILKPS